ncbi:MAG: uracil-DNA glycosylase [Bauldia sp.]
MGIALREAMQEILSGWRQDLGSDWQSVVQNAEPGFAAIDPGLMLEVFEPVFPVRKGQKYLGAPKGAHIFRAFDGIAPADVHCVVLGQDPYPDASFSTGRAFEAGNVRWWRELEKMFSVSVRTFMQLIVAARTGDASYARSTADWRRLVDDVESGRLPLEPAATIADRWVEDGVLLLNSALTLSRFAVEGDPHQLRGHLPLWRPFIAAVLGHLAGRGNPVVFIAFGGQAASALRDAGVEARVADRMVKVILREHPARGDEVLKLENPFVLANRFLGEAGAQAISW